MGFLASLLAAFGTAIQFRENVLKLREQEPAVVGAYVAVGELRREVRWYRPLRWWQHRRLLGRLLRENPVEASGYRRLQWVLTGWASLWFAAVLSATKELMELLN